MAVYSKLQSVYKEEIIAEIYAYPDGCLEIKCMGNWARIFFTPAEFRCQHFPQAGQKCCLL